MTCQPFGSAFPAPPTTPIAFRCIAYDLRGVLHATAAARPYSRAGPLRADEERRKRFHATTLAAFVRYSSQNVFGKEKRDEGRGEKFLFDRARSRFSHRWRYIVEKDIGSVTKDLSLFGEVIGGSLGTTTFKYMSWSLIDVRNKKMYAQNF